MTAATTTTTVNITTTTTTTITMTEIIIWKFQEHPNIPDRRQRKTLVQKFYFLFYYFF